MTKKFRWEKWIDPLNSNIDEVEVVPKPIDIEDMPEYLEEDDNSAMLIRDEEEGEELHSVTPMKVAHTKLGMVTLTEYSLLANNFNFYILHTNFDIGIKEASIIEQCPGVETLAVITRYRVKIGFPKSTKPQFNDDMWNLSALQMNIEKELMAEDNAETTFQELSDDLEEARLEASKNRYWAIIQFPNKTIDTISSDEKNKQFMSQLELFRELQQHAGCLVFSSED